MKSITSIVGLLACVLSTAAAHAQTTVPSQDNETTFLDSGSWTDSTHWSNGLPTSLKPAIVRGSSTLTIPPGTYAAALLEVGNHPGDRSRVELNGGQLLLRQDSLRIGEYTNSEGTFLLNDGAMHCVMDVFVGGVTGSTKRMNKATLTLNGGTFLGLSLTVGEGLGSDARVTINGSRPTAIHALEAVSLLAAADPSGKPGQSTLAFTLDEQGVTPITIHSHWDGLRIVHDNTSHCRLEISLSAVPPREDIPLVISHAATQGTFDNLPEGAEITADFAGHTYRWALTYHGGAQGHDLMLLNRSQYPADAPVTHVRPLPEIPTPLWRDHPVYPLALPIGQPAFPGAEGYGAYTTGGKNGQTLYVENLNDTGPGSLRAAVDTLGPRTILFHVGGVIPLQSTLTVNEPNLTLNAASAPAPGITLRRHGIEVHTHNVILQQFRIRIGDEDVRTNDQNIRYAAGDGEYALYFSEGAENCIADHLSLGWSTNKILSTTKQSDRITIQWCILSESLNLDGHGYASIAGGNRVTWHHNLFAHNNSRNVRFQGAVDADFRNNVIYDWGEKSAYGEFDRLNYVGNYLKPGPSTTQRPLLYHDGKEVVLPGSLYLANNVLETNAKATADNWKGTGFYFDKSVAAPTPFPAPPVTTESASAAYDHVLQDAGATHPTRDPLDERILKEVRTGTGKIIQSPTDVGGWPKSPSSPQ